MTMVDEIITIAELERGTFALNLQVTDLAPLARHAVDDVSRQYPDIKIEAHIPESLEAVPTGPGSGRWSGSCWTTPAGTPHRAFRRTPRRNLEEGAMVQVSTGATGWIATS